MYVKHFIDNPEIIDESELGHEYDEVQVNCSPNYDDGDNDDGDYENDDDDGMMKMMMMFNILVRS